MSVFTYEGSCGQKLLLLYYSAAFHLEISTSSMMGNQLKSTLAVAVQMVTPFRKPCDLVSLRVSVIVS